MNIALVHDYLREYGGAERVVEALHEMWPEAPLYTSFVDWPSLAKAPAGKVELFKSMDIRTSWVEHVWLVKKLISPLRFLAPMIWGSFNLSGYDVVISSSGWFMCRGVSIKKPAVHISYIHHPPRNLYGYATGSDWQKYPIVRIYGAIVNFFLRHYDFETAQAVDYFVANSKETARRVKKFYRRESTVIYPPVEISKGLALKTRPQGKALRKQDYFLSVGRLTWAKRIDLAIEACNKLKLPLKIVGTGKEEEYLRSIAGPTVEFLGSVSDEELSRLYLGAKALIFCALDEDFGMVPVEAMAAGVPVIALAQGGVVETVVDGETGVLFREPTVECLVEGIKRWEDSKTGRWEQNCRKQAQKFSKERFKKELKAFVEHHLDDIRHTTYNKGI
ncbi:MAG: glycosyltransferase [Candidatus Gottesmanbacteria bacterium GW2011_GWA2_47_9]|uniref:Glycosyltransferase n=2 Tax=Candidatus Gottesmaniibacteriota TaxID=1752720 RepID=A0A0G1UMM0_9BACT|nr:MAG: glycosyltransferase [Candidatus Gottesmanbacteria bacterium GW2011_GWA2_47_9]KKU95341.1 MAG: glycosyltransferase [Candidatus Gottesmanbacteria bacterium GW2011_GWA1_48_13]